MPMTNIMDATGIKYFQHRSEGSVIEIFFSIRESYETADFVEANM